MRIKVEKYLKPQLEEDQATGLSIILGILIYIAYLKIESSATVWQLDIVDNQLKNMF